jgi:hypothetical protein
MANLLDGVRVLFAGRLLCRHNHAILSGLLADKGTQKPGILYNRINLDRLFVVSLFATNQWCSLFVRKLRGQLHHFIGRVSLQEQATIGWRTLCWVFGKYGIKFIAVDNLRFCKSNKEEILIRILNENPLTELEAPKTRARGNTDLKSHVFFIDQLCYALAENNNRASSSGPTRFD